MNSTVKHWPLMSTVQAHFRRFYSGGFSCTSDELFSPEWLEALELAAKESGTTRSRVAQMAFFEYFEKRNIAV